MTALTIQPFLSNDLETFIDGYKNIAIEGTDLSTTSPFRKFLVGFENAITETIYDFNFKPQYEITNSPAGETEIDLTQWRDGFLKATSNQPDLWDPLFDNLQQELSIIVSGADKTNPDIDQTATPCPDEITRAIYKLTAHIDSLGTYDESIGQTVDEITEAISTVNEGFSQHLILDATSISRKLIPFFIDYVEKFDTDNIYRSIEDTQKTLFALLFLGRWRVTDAFPVILNHFRKKGEDGERCIYMNYGDYYTGGLPSILAETYSKEHLPLLLDFVKDPSIDPILRSTVLSSLQLIYALGSITRVQAKEILDSLFDYEWEESERIQMLETVGAKALSFRFNDHKDRFIKIAQLTKDEEFKEFDIKDIEDTYGLSIDETDDEMARYAKRFSTHHWLEELIRVGLYEDYDDSDMDDGMDWDLLDSKPGTNPKVGRNDPCPCGSGKKFKKCCGG